MERIDIFEENKRLRQELEQERRQRKEWQKKPNKGLRISLLLLHTCKLGEKEGIRNSNNYVSICLKLMQD